MSLTDKQKQDLLKYLPQDTKVNKTRDYIERANAQFSCIDILNEDYGCEIPYGGSGSTKIHCIWGWEHKDAGREKCMRYYWETDQAFCFRDHGVIDVVAIRANQWNISKLKTAKELLTKAGVFGNNNWHDTIEKAQDNLSKTGVNSVDMHLAEQLLNQQLKTVEGYGRLQYRPSIINAKIELQEQLDLSWSMDELLQWITRSKEYLKEVMRAEEGLR